MELLKFVEQNDLEGFKENLDMDSIEELDEKRNTILHYCVDMDKYDFVDALLYNGADPNVKNREGNTSLHIAAQRNYGKIMELLLEFGGDLDIKNNHQRTATNLAIAAKANSVLKAIENSGADYDGAGAGFEKINHHRKLEDF
jgi:ankyrin repeat protein